MNRIGETSIHLYTVIDGNTWSDMTTLMHS